MKQLRVATLNVGKGRVAKGACFASFTKTAQNSVFGGEIIQNVGLRGKVAYIYIPYISHVLAT